MKRLVLFIAAVIAVGVPVTAHAQRETETVERTVPFPTDGTLHLKNFSGRITITGGSGRDIVMKAWRTGRPERLKETELRVTTEGRTVEIDANYRNDDTRRRDRDNERNNVVETRFELQVPAAARLVIEGFSSEVEVTGVEGSQRIKTFSGDIRTVSARGPLDVETFSGSIDVDATRQGANPDLRLETFSGSMRLRVAEGAKGELQLDTFSGDLDSDIPLRMRSTSRRSLRAELPGGSGQTLRVKSFSGSLRLVR
jgi:DUF4097 and DUF4098 domain-containing protein YvlB